MKKSLTTLALLLGLTIGVMAQGTVNFQNFNAEIGLDQPIYGIDGVTPLAGPGFVAQLYFSATEGGTYTAVSAQPAPFRTGAGAGYWNPGDTSRTLDGIAAGSTAWLQVRVWDASQFATFDEAVAGGGLWGDSILHGPGAFSITTGNAGSPPSLPAGMVGFESFALVPEPSTFVLAALGAVGLLLFRRRK